MELRNLEAIQKKPATAELLVWLAILSARRITTDELRTRKLNELPAKEALIKDIEDRKRLDGLYSLIGKPFSPRCGPRAYR